MKPYKLLRHIDMNGLRKLAQAYYPNGLKSNKINREQLMITINSNVRNIEKNPLEIYLKQIDPQAVKNNAELKKILQQIIHSNESSKVIKLAKDLFTGKVTPNNKNTSVDYVYLVQESVSKTIKIGYTNNPKRRFAEFKVQLPFKITHIHTIQCVKGREVEKLLHKHFQNKRVNGEWFRLTKEDIENIKERNLPNKILAMITGENIAAYVAKPKQKIKKSTIKKTIAKTPEKPLFDDNDYLLYEREFDEFRRDPFIQSYDESRHATGRNRDFY